VPKVINVCSPSWAVSRSFGRMAVEVKNGLEARGWMVNTIGNNPPNRLFVPCFTSVLIGHPSSFSKYGVPGLYGKRIYLGMFESTKLPASWAAEVNQLDAVIVPCQWNKQVFADNDITVPVSVAPLGISESFRYARRKPNNVFRFLAFGDRGRRKGADRAPLAFVRAFGKRDDVELVFKQHDYFVDGATNANIRVINEAYTEEQLNALYASCDAMIFPSCGEGFGLPPREFAATGGIPIATNYGGLADDLLDWGIPLACGTEPAWVGHPMFDGLGEWADPDMDDLVEKMHMVRDLPLDERNRMGFNFFRNVRRLYYWDKLVDEIERVLVGEVSSKIRELA